MAQEEEEAKPPAVPRGIWAGAGATNVLICAQQDIETVEAALHAQEAAQVQGFGRQQLTRGTLEGTDEVAEDEGGRGRKDASGSEGKADATRTLLEQVTLVEAYYMLERGQLRVCAIKQDGPEEELSAAEAWRVFGASQAYSSPRRFAVMYNAYKSLREQGWIVKMGQTYGAHFAVYQGDPDFFHSQFCILVADEDKDEPYDWITVTREMRVAQQTSKELMLCSVKLTQPEDTPACAADTDFVILLRWMLQHEQVGKERQPHKKLHKKLLQPSQKTSNKRAAST